MCYIGIIKNLGGRVDETPVHNALFDQVASNPDGSWGRVRRASDSFEMRTMEAKKIRRFLRIHTKPEEQAADPVNWLMCHFRYATSGAKTLKNVHGYERGGWVFAHNGSCTDLSDGWSAEKSDSLNFFEKLFPLLPADHANQAAVLGAFDAMTKQYNLYGRFMLYSPVTDKLYLLGSWWLYKLNNLIWLSSKAVDFQQLSAKKDDIENINGLEVVKPSIAVAEGGLFGIGVIHDFSSDNFRYEYLGEIAELETKWNYNSKNGGAKESFDSKTNTITVNDSRADYDSLELAPDDLPPADLPPADLPLVQSGLQWVKINKQDFLICGQNRLGLDLIWSEDTGLHDVKGSCCMADECDKNWDWVEADAYDLIIENHYAAERAGDCKNKYLLF